MNFLKNKLSVFLLLAAFLVQTGAVFLYFPAYVHSQDDELFSTFRDAEVNTSTNTEVFLNEEDAEFNVVGEIEIIIANPLPNTKLSERIRFVARANRPVDVMYFILEGTEDRQFLALRENEYTYFYQFDTRELPNGSYYLIAEAHWEDNEKKAVQRVYIENEIVEASTQENATVNTSSEQEEETSEQSMSTTTESNPQDDSALNYFDDEEQSYDDVYSVDNIQSYGTSSDEQDNETFVATTTAFEEGSETERKIKIEDIPEFVNGPVTIKARANFVPDSLDFVITGKEIKTVPAKQIGPYLYTLFFVVPESTIKEEFNISAVARLGDSEFSDTIKLVYEKEFFESEEVVTELELEFINPPETITGDAKIIVAANLPLDKIEFFVEGKISRKFTSQSELENTYFFIWPSQEFPDGFYELSAGAIELGVLKKKIVSTVAVRNNFDISVDDLDNFDSEKNILDELTNNDDFEFEKININPECKVQGIVEEKACNEYLSLPVMCRLQGIKNQDQCLEYIGLDPVCRERNYSPSRCEQYKNLPEPCQKAEEFSDEECRRLVKINSLPPECREQGIDSHVECEKYILRSQMPEKCQILGLETIEECQGELVRSTGEKPRLELAQICVDNNINDQEKCNLFIGQRREEKECEMFDISNSKECNDFLFDKYGLSFCAKVEIDSKSECRAYLFNNYKDLLKCDKENEWECQNNFRENYLGRILEKQTKFESLREELNIAKPDKIQAIKNRLGDSRIIPLQDDELVVRMHKAKEEIVVNEDEEIIQVSPAVLIIDSDQDGLPDSTEERIGTDPGAKDSDGDGYDDKAELENGYNPLGPGKLVGNVLSSIDQAIITNQVIEHPKTSGDLSGDYRIDEIKTVSSELDEVKAYYLSGKAEPGQVLSLYIYSDLPIITTVATDENGNWQYEFKNVLTEGDHEVYVVVNDNTGRVIKKSSPLNFFIKEARAVSVHDYFASAVISNPDEPAGMINYYLIVAFVLIASSVFLFVFYLVYYRKKQIA